MSSNLGFSLAVSILAGLAALTPASARADETALSAAQAKEAAREYYSDEISASFLFMGYGAVQAGVGGVALTQSGDFARGLGWSNLIGGGLTALGGVGYALAVKVRGDYYKGLADTDLARFKAEEAEHIGGTNRHFVLYLGFEIVETLVGAGIATYGLAAKKDLYKGIGSGVALTGLGLFVIDVPGAGRAAKYDDQIRRFNPQVGFAMGGGTRPWAATLTQTF